MKRYFTLFFLLLPFLSTSQTGYESTRNNGVNQTTERYVINSPGNTPTTSRSTWRTHDSTYIEWLFANAYFRNLPNSKDDGMPVNIVHTDATGRLLVSPLSYLYPDTIMTFATRSYLMNNFYNQAQSDLRYLQSYSELDPLSLHISDTVNKWLGIGYVPSWASITGKPSFFSGEYDSLLHKPTIPTNTNQLTNGAGFLNSETDPLFDTKFSGKTTSGLTEGSNLYYTSTRFNTAFGTKSTSDLTEGTNLYYTVSRFNTAFLTKSTSDLTEGTNLYWTSARFTSALTSVAIATSLGYTPATSARTLTINGVSFDLTTNRTWTVGDVTTASLTSTLANYATTSALTSGLATKEGTITAGTSAQYWRGDKTFQTLNTGAVPESTNLYYTDTRSRVALSAGTGISYNNTTGVISTSIPSINAVTRSINSSTFTPSSTLQATLNYCIQISCTASIGSNASGAVLLQYSTNGGSSWNDAGTVRNSNTVTLAVALNSVTIQTATISAVVPANALCRLVPTTSGTTSITWISGQEIY